MTNYHFGWMDFDEDEFDYIPDKYIATVGVWTGTEEDSYFSDEVFTITHRASERYPLDGDVAERKRQDAEALANILNIAHAWEDQAVAHRPQEALEAFTEIVAEVRKILDRNS